MSRKSSCIINRRNTELWKEDTIKSVSLYNDWFLDFAPITYTKERKRAMEQVELAISQTNNFHFTTTHLKEHPEFITILRWLQLLLSHVTDLSDFQVSNLLSLRIWRKDVCRKDCLRKKKRTA